MAGVRPKPQMSIYDETYWDFARKGQLRLQRCEACGMFRYPPAAACPACLADGGNWVRLSGRGRIVSWTIFHRAYFPTIPVPYTVVSVRTDEGPMLIGNLVNAGSGRPAFDLPVEAVFQQVDFDGESWRLCQWQPLS